MNDPIGNEASVSQINGKRDINIIEEIERKTQATEERLKHDGKDSTKEEFEAWRNYLDSACHCVHVGKFIRDVEEIDEVVSNMAGDFRHGCNFEGQIEKRIQKPEVKLYLWAPCLDNRRPEGNESPDSKHSGQEGGDEDQSVRRSALMQEMPACLVRLSVHLQAEL